VISKPTPDQLTKMQREQAYAAHRDAVSTLLGGTEKAEAKALVPKQATVPAPVTNDAVQDYLDTHATSTIPGTLVRFNGKDARYVLLNGEDLPVKPDARFFFLSDQIWGGWIKFPEEGGAPESIQGLLNDGFRVPPREELGDDDQSQWKIGLNGDPEDPWKQQLVALLQDCGSGEIYAFLATNPTSRGAVTDLMMHCQRRKRNGKDDYPIVTLDKDSFERREPPKVKVWKPKFHIVGHQAKDKLHDTSLAGDADMNDSIPF
jgi:hypothetical protein